MEKLISNGKIYCEWKIHPILMKSFSWQIRLCGLGNHGTSAGNHGFIHCQSGLVVVQIFPYQASSRIMPKTLQVWSLILPVAMILTWLHYLIPSWKPIIMGGYASINSYFRVPTNNHNHIGVFFIYPLVNIQKTMENRHFWMAILQLFLWPFSSSQTLLKQIIPWTSPVLLVQSPLPSGNLT